MCNGGMNGSNGLLGEYKINTINHNSSSGVLEVEYLYRPHLSISTIKVDINISSSGFFEKEKRKEVYKKRKSIIKKLLE